MNQKLLEDEISKKNIFHSNNLSLFKPSLNEKYALVSKAIEDVYFKMDKMERKIDNTIKWVGNLCIATIVGIIFIVLSMSVITFTIIVTLLK